MVEKLMVVFFMVEKVMVEKVMVVKFMDEKSEVEALRRPGLK